MESSNSCRNEIQIRGDLEEIWRYVSTLEGYLSFLQTAGRSRARRS